MSETLALRRGNRTLTLSPTAVQSDSLVMALRGPEGGVSMILEPEHQETIVAHLLRQEWARDLFEGVAEGEQEADGIPEMAQEGENMANLGRSPRTVKQYSSRGKRILASRRSEARA